MRRGRAGSRNRRRRDDDGGRPGSRSAPARKGSRASQTAPTGRGRRQVEGVVSAHRAGYGFLRVEGMTASIFLPPPEMRGLMHGDRVRVSATRESDGRWSGRVEEVLGRGVSAFLGTLEVYGRAAWATAADRRLTLRCAVPLDELKGARHGDWVIARITQHASSSAPAVARIERRLDPDRPVELATETAIARFELPRDFSAEVLREAQAFGTQVDAREAKARVDLRELPLVTIDGESAKDFDDAVYAEKKGTGFRLVVAIADVSYYVRPGSALDVAAIGRGTSVYFPTRVVPMLPHALSDHLCSLAPHVDRLCFVADMEIGRTGKLGGAKFYPAVMRSHARLTYTQVNAAVFEGRVDARRELEQVLQPLEVLASLYRVLLKARGRRGALDFDAAEAEFVIDAAERVRRIELRVRNDAHRLIEECMILANVAVARELEDAKAGTLYRVHGTPDETKLDRLLSALTSLGIAAEIPESVEPRHLQAITQRLGESADRPFVESLVVRAMPQAVYQPANIGHFGLALEQYAHFTSPIRRYPDLVVHRTLKALVAAKDGSGRTYGEETLASLGESLSRLEKRADEADRYVATFLKCAYLRERIGQTFRGLITTVVEFGCFVQILDVSVDGLLHVDSLGDDQYVMSDDQHAWVGRRNGRRLRTGMHVYVTVTAVNPVEGLVDLMLAEGDADDGDAGR